MFFKKILILLETFSECKDKWDNGEAQNFFEERQQIKQDEH